MYVVFIGKVHIYMENFFDWKEQENIRNLHKFNEDHHWFTSITPTERFDHTDAVCMTADNRKITVELKTRDAPIEQFKKWGTVLIEPQKLAHFSLIMESGFTLGETCLYINFASDGVIIFDFNQLKNVQMIPNHKHYNKGKRKCEYETRFALDMKEAIIL